MKKKSDTKETAIPTKIESHLDLDADETRTELGKYGLSNARILRTRDGKGRLVDNQRMLMDLDKMKEYVLSQDRKDLLPILQRAEKMGEFYTLWNEQEKVIWKLEYVIDSERVYFDFHTEYDAVYSERIEGEKWLDCVYRELVNLGYHSEILEIKLKEVFSTQEADDALNDLISEKIDREMYENFTPLEDMLREKLRESFQKIGSRISETNKLIGLVSNEDVKNEEF